jgi:hypothetical protein
MRRHSKAFLTLVLVLPLAAWPVPAHADAGVPMFVLFAPVMGLSLLPIILVESFYLRGALKTPFGRSPGNFLRQSDHLRPARRLCSRMACVVAAFPNPRSRQDLIPGRGVGI